MKNTSNLILTVFIVSCCFSIAQSFQDAELRKDSLQQLKSHEYFIRFKNPVKFKITSILQEKGVLHVKKDDVFEISLQNGLIVYRKNEKYQQYKFIPETKNIKYFHSIVCAVPPCPRYYTKTENYFAWNNFAFDVKPINDTRSVMRVLNLETEKDHLEEKDWIELYELKIY